MKGLKSKSINFPALGKRLLVSTRTLVPRWLPSGRIEGHEYVALNPTRPDKSLGSFRINLRKGFWKDFATGDKGGDLISLYAYVKGLSQIQSARELLKTIGGQDD